jgi:hypothetical protein
MLIHVVDTQIAFTFNCHRVFIIDTEIIAQKNRPPVCQPKDGF